MKKMIMLKMAKTTKLDTCHLGLMATKMNKRFMIMERVITMMRRRTRHLLVEWIRKMMV